MKRISITDGNGKWFDASKAMCYEENYIFNGREYISEATNDKRENEQLYITEKGQYILNHSSCWQGVADTYRELTMNEAANWFAKQSFKEEEIPESLINLVKEHEI